MELSISELESETVELLPERETLSIVIIGQQATAVAGQAFFAKATASNSANVNIGSVVGSFDGNHLHLF
jgi:hypothetical protein